MMTYKHLTLAETIEALAAMDPETVVRGIHGGVQSYRGFYDQIALSPTGVGYAALHLATWLQSQVGSTMEGYKGGEFQIKEDCHIFIAEWGDTGPGLGGFVYVGKDAAEPIGILGDGYL